jgi:hypothetical protein
MANPNPKIEQLALGRGKRPVLGHETVTMRLAPGIRQQLEQIAQHYDCMYGGKPWIAGLLTKIGNSELAIVPIAPYISEIKVRRASSQQFKDIQEKRHNRKNYIQKTEPENIQPID